MHCGSLRKHKKLFTFLQRLTLLSKDVKKELKQALITPDYTRYSILLIYNMQTQVLRIVI